MIWPQHQLRAHGVGTGGGPPRDWAHHRDEFPASLPNLLRRTELFALETIQDRLSVVEGELNCLYSCYTSQSRIKMANKVAENALGRQSFFRL